MQGSTGSVNREAATASGPWDRLWIGCNLATMVDADLGRIVDGAIAVVGERIAWLGRARDLPGHPDALAREVLECRGGWITPGLVDCHTHLVFAGDRSDEFRRRLHGESYEDIARSGGGIQATVGATRAATTDHLREGAVARATELMAWGVTTVEIKSGYGLELDTELRMLRAAADVATVLPIDVSPTLLAAHAIPPEYAGRRSEYVQLVVGEIIPAAVEQGVATAIDAFCEGIAFTPEEARLVLTRGIQAGLKGRLHADQLSDCGGGALAAAVGARSADHLEFLSLTGVRAMAESGVTAVLLPGAYYFLGGGRPPPVALLREAGVPMAVATDANPGSSPITNVGLILNMACVLFGLTPEEALLGLTRRGAAVLALDGDRGSLAVGRRADLAVWDVGDPTDLCYWLGSSPLAYRVKDGRIMGGDRAG